LFVDLSIFYEEVYKENPEKGNRAVLYDNCDLEEIKKFRYVDMRYNMIPYCDGEDLNYLKPFIEFPLDISERKSFLKFFQGLRKVISPESIFEDLERMPKDINLNLKGIFKAGLVFQDNYEIDKNFGGAEILVSLGRNRFARLGRISCSMDHRLCDNWFTLGKEIVHINLSTRQKKLSPLKEVHRKKLEEYRFFGVKYEYARNHEESFEDYFTEGEDFFYVYD
jgi:hypothetical protein